MGFQVLAPVAYWPALNPCLSVCADTEREESEEREEKKKDTEDQKDVQTKHHGQMTPKL